MFIRATRIIRGLLLQALLDCIARALISGQVAVGRRHINVSANITGRVDSLARADVAGAGLASATGSATGHLTFQMGFLKWYLDDLTHRSAM